MIFMVLSSRIHCKLQIKTLTLALGKQLNSLIIWEQFARTILHEILIENIQFWLTPREESEGTL